MFGGIFFGQVPYAGVPTFIGQVIATVVDVTEAITIYTHDNGVAMMDTPNTTIALQLK